MNIVILNGLKVQKPGSSPSQEQLNSQVSVPKSNKEHNRATGQTNPAKIQNFDLTLIQKYEFIQ